MLKRSRRDEKDTWKNCTKEDLNEPDYCDGVVSHPEPDMLQCEVKWALGSTSKASRCDGIPAELFTTLKDDVIKVLHSVCRQSGRPNSGQRTGKGQSSSQFPKTVLLKTVLAMGQLHSSLVLVSEVKWSDVAQLCSTLCDPMDCSPPGSSVHGILQARILEWVTISFSRDLPSPGIEPRSPTLQADALASEPPGKPHASKVMLKTLHARLQYYVNQELPDIQAGFRKRLRNQRSSCQHLLDHRESKGIPEKHLPLFHRLC